MGLVDLVKDLESPDGPTRFKAATALYRLGVQAAPAIPKLVGLLRDIDGVNVPVTDGGERLVTIAERAALALAAVGEAAAAAVIEELKKDNAVSAIHCVRALSAPALARRVPVALINERLMRPKVSPAMASALCDVLYAASQAPDEAVRGAAKSAFKAAYAAGRVTQKYHKLFAPAGAGTPTPATLPPVGPAAPPAAPAPSSGGWVSAAVAPAAKPAPPPPPAPTPAPAAPAAAAVPPAPDEPPARPPSSVPRHGRYDRPTSFGFQPTDLSEGAELESPAPEPPPRPVSRPEPPPVEVLPQKVAQTTATFDPEILFEKPIPEPTPRAAAPGEPRRHASPTATYQPELIVEKPSPGAVPAAAAPASDDPRFSYRGEITRILRNGDKLGAVKLLRERTGASLVEALKQIEGWAG